MEQILFREDPLAGLAKASSCQGKLTVVHDALKERCPGIDRISVALFDSQTNSLKTFIASPAAESPLKNHEVVLRDQSSLKEVVRNGRPRVINDLRVYADHESVHSRAIFNHGFASSYTHPMYHNSQFTGFIFLNSFHNRHFRDRVVEQVEIFVHLLSEMVLNDLTAARALAAAMRTSISMMQKHDVETGSHLERMSRYTRLIARYLAQKDLEPIDDEQIEQMALFSTLHDIGKIGISDLILQKPQKLTRQERDSMNTHTVLGRQIAEDLISNFGFENVPYIEYLRQITEEHHEAIDGSGYPHGLCGREISLAGRIVAVSDVFDALTTQRPYKAPWSNEHSFAMLKLLAIDRLDKNCVDALIDFPDEIVKIQQQFNELH